MKMGAHHTLEIELNNKLTLAKERLRATLYDHSHDAKGRVKEASQYIDVHWCHISLCRCLPPNPILFCGSNRLFLLNSGHPSLHLQDRWDAMHLQALDDATDVHKTSEDS